MGALGEFFLVPPGCGVGFGRPLVLLSRSPVPVAGEETSRSILALVDQGQRLSACMGKASEQPVLPLGFQLLKIRHEDICIQEGICVIPL